MTRLEANKQILERINGVVETYPELRFEQIMVGLGLEWMSFCEESTDTLEIINDHLGKMKEVKNA
jgi:hypothetical protein